MGGRFPAHRATHGEDRTYGTWLLESLGLPRLRVPRAPTQPESEPTTLGIGDYLNYCVLSQNEIDTSVLGHTDPFKNIKRKYVFEVLYGLYGEGRAELQDELRRTLGQLRALRADGETLDRLLVSTPWANRAELERRATEARTELAERRAAGADVARRATESAGTRRLRDEIVRLDERVADLRAQVEREGVAARRLEELRAQLSAQSSRLTRSIVADSLLLGYEFQLCPRCGAEVDAARGATQTCALCLQAPQPTYRREDLIKEQDRLQAQIAETEELVGAHTRNAAARQEEIDRGEALREELAGRLNRDTARYVSDAADQIASSAADAARLEETVRRLEDYLGLFTRRDAAMRDMNALEQRQEELEAQLEADEADRGEAWRRVVGLEQRLDRILERLHAPEIGEEEATRIDRATYLPIVRGRSFDDLGSLGLKVLVNVAHALAHHETSLEQRMGLPGMLIIDGPSSNIGREGVDRQRIESIYSYLIEVGNRLGEDLQIIVADTDVPGNVAPYVRVSFTEDDRLVPRESRQA